MKSFHRAPGQHARQVDRPIKTGKPEPVAQGEAQGLRGIAVGRHHAAGMKLHEGNLAFGDGLTETADELGRERAAAIGSVGGAAKFVAMRGSTLHGEHGGRKLFAQEGADVAQSFFGLANKGFVTNNLVALGVTRQIALSETHGIKPPGSRTADSSLSIRPEGKRSFVAVAGVANHVNHPGAGISSKDVVGITLNQAGLIAPTRFSFTLGVMNLEEGDFIVSMDVVDPEADLLVVTANGYGKRTPLKQYPAKGRATGGVMTIDQKNLGTTGKIVSARIVRPEDDLTVISAGGVALRTKMANVRQAGRATMGTRIITLKEGDTVASVARLAEADLKLGGAEEENGSGKLEESVAEPELTN